MAFLPQHLSLLGVQDSRIALGAGGGLSRSMQSIGLEYGGNEFSKEEEGDLTPLNFMFPQFSSSN